MNLDPEKTLDPYFSLYLSVNESFVMINTQIQLAILGYGKECTKKNGALAATVGKFAGRQDISLVGGNVSATFNEAFKAASFYKVATICVIEKHKNLQKEHFATEVYRSSDTYAKHSQIAQMADAAIIIGGGAGSQLLLKYFMRNKKTVIAIKGTGGLADSKLPKGVLMAAHPSEAFKMLYEVKRRASINTDLGNLQLTFNHLALAGLKLSDEKSENHKAEKNPFIKQLEKYFSGKKTEFTGKIFLNGTEFQNKVWRSLLDIPYGKTMEYGELAELLGDKKASSAVGQAAGQNPIWIIIPCHRLMGHDGGLTAYAGGLEMKMRLLDLEKHQTELRIF